MDTEKIKNDFPIFDKVRSLVYLDTTATSQTPQVVLDAMNEYYTSFRANVHRASYEEGESASEAYEESRIKVALFIGADTREVIFTAGATGSSNMLVSMLENSDVVRAGDEIVTTVMEHHASMIPLQELAKRQGLTLKHIPLAKDSVALDYDEAVKLITPRTKIVSVMLASNVTGVVNDVARVTQLAHKVGALVICDATAAVGHMPVDVKKIGVDFMYFSGHKMCGPTGVGVLWGKQEILKTLEPGVYGGGIVDEVTLEKAMWRDIPARFEAGTPNIAGVIGLGAAVDYLSEVGIENIHAHCINLARETVECLSQISGVAVYAMGGEQNMGIVSFTIGGIHAHDIAEILGRDGVAVRAGHHCAMPLISTFGVTATARVSFYLYNSSEDIDALVRGIKKAKEIFKK